MRRKPRAPDDRVSPELRRYVFGRDGACVVYKLAKVAAIPSPGPCRSHRGKVVLPTEESEWTLAHVRDRKGGRMGKRPPSTPRRLATVCAGHHLLDPVIDRGDVRDAADSYLEALEGPELEEVRWWEVVQRVRGPGRGADLVVPRVKDGPR